MSDHDVIRAPLPARWRLGAELRLADRRFGADALLLAADAFEELAQEAAFRGARIAVAQARALAECLRATAPERAV